jgi:hypothetical protein
MRESCAADRQVREGLLTTNQSRPYRVVVTSPRSFAYAFYYYGFPVTGRGWRRMRD